MMCQPEIGTNPNDPEEPQIVLLWSDRPLEENIISNIKFTNKTK